MNDNELIDDDEDFEELTAEEIIVKIPEFKSAKLADIIVAHRYLGFYKNLYVPCMEQLAKRRIAGDDWDFEQYIENQINDMPKLSFNLNDLNAALVQLKKMSTQK